jgi:hypothetical protein
LFVIDHDPEPTHTTLPLGVNIKTPPTSPFLYCAQQPGPPSNSFVSHESADTSSPIEDKDIHNTTSSRSVVSTDGHHIVSSLYIDPRILQQDGEKDSSIMSKRRHTSLSGDVIVTTNNDLSLFMSQSILDRANNIGMLQHELPYVRLQWILYGISTFYGQIGPAVLVMPIDNVS